MNVPRILATVTVLMLLSVGAGADVVCGWVEWEEAMPLTNEMKRDYEAKFASSRLHAERHTEVEQVITRVLKSRERYRAVADPLRIPWYLVAVIHQLECSGRFDCHLHNGDPLRARTVQVPRGRPLSGKAPFTWEESAQDALSYHGFDAWRDWSIGGLLYKLEIYNGLGYRRIKQPIPSPYLWAGSQHYQRGKFARDGVYDPKLVSKQLGAAVLIRRMLDHHLIEVPEPAAMAVGVR